MLAKDRLNAHGLEQQAVTLAQDLRALAQKHVEIGRELTLMADRIERGDGLQPVALGEIAERVIARILRGEGDDAG